MKKKCFQCGVVNWQNAEECVRCGSFLNQTETPVASEVDQSSNGSIIPTIIGCVLIIGLIAGGFQFFKSMSNNYFKERAEAQVAAKKKKAEEEAKAKAEQAEKWERNSKEAQKRMHIQIENNRKRLDRDMKRQTDKWARERKKKLAKEFKNRNKLRNTWECKKLGYCP